MTPFSTTLVQVLCQIFGVLLRPKAVIVLIVLPNFYKNTCRVRVWDSVTDIEQVLKFNIKIGKHPAMPFMAIGLRVLKEEMFRGVFRTLSNLYGGAFFKNSVC